MNFLEHRSVMIRVVLIDGLEISQEFGEVIYSLGVITFGSFSRCPRSRTSAKVVKYGLEKMQCQRNSRELFITHLS